MEKKKGPQFFVQIRKRGKGSLHRGETRMKGGEASTRGGRKRNYY